MAQVTVDFKANSQPLIAAINALTKNVDKLNKTFQQQGKAVKKVANETKKLKKVSKDSSNVIKRGVDAATRSYKEYAKAVKKAQEQENKRRQFQSQRGRQVGGAQVGGGGIGAGSVMLMGLAARQKSPFEGFTKANLTGANAMRAMGAAAKFATPLLAAYLGVAGVKKLAQVAEVSQRIENRLRLTVQEGGNVDELFGRMAQVATETRQPFEQMATMLFRISQAGERMGITQEQAITTTELFGKMLTIQGATMHESRSALLQFSQSLQAGKLAGDEFRSISEVLPSLLKLLADETGEPIEKLKDLAAAGKLTPDLMVRAVLKAHKDIEEQFKKTVVTIEQGMNILTTKTIVIVRSFLATETGAALLKGIFAGLGAVIDVLGTAIAGITLVLDQVVKAMKALIQITLAVVDALNKAWNATKRFMFALVTLGNDLNRTKENTKEQNAMLEVLSQNYERTAKGAYEAAKAISVFGHQAKLPELEGEDKQKVENIQKLRDRGLTEEQIKKIQGMDAVVKKFGDSVTSTVFQLTQGLRELVFKTIAVDMAQGMGDAFAGMIMEGESFKDSMKSLFKDMAKQVIAQITRMIIQMILMRTIMASLGMTTMDIAAGGFGAAFSNPFKFIGGLFGGGKGTEAGAGALPFKPLDMLIPKAGQVSGGKILKKLGVGGFATGGPIGAGQLSIVGEKGPELFVPNSAGDIIPNDELGGRPMIIQNLSIFPHANIDQALMNKPMTYWTDLAQNRILPALNQLGQVGATTNLTFEESR